MSESPRLLPSAQWLKEHLNTRWAGKGDVIYREEIPSTNTLLKELARADAPGGQRGGLRFSKCRTRPPAAGLAGGGRRNPARLAFAQAPSDPGTDFPLHAGGGSCGCTGHRAGLP